MKPLSVGERIRRSRRTVAKAKALLATTTNERSRLSLMRAIAILEKEDHERMALSRQPPPETVAQRAARVKARALELLRQSDTRNAREEAQSFVSQQRRHREQTVANFTAQSMKHADPPTPKIESQASTWRGHKIVQTWQGKKI